MRKRALSAAACAALVFVPAACAGGGPQTTPPTPRDGDPATADAAFASTYVPLPAQTTVIRNATVMTAAGPTMEAADVLMVNGRIEAVGAGLDSPAGAIEVDGAGKWVTPGIIDTHSHMGVYSAPGGASLSDGNEATAPNTAEVWAEHSVWTQDPQFALALAAGVTTFHVLPGSANLFGGRGVTLRNVPARTTQGMKFPGAPYTLKMACGENPMRVYGNRGRSPSTRMGNVAGYRSAWIEAAEYKRRRDRWRADGSDPDEEPRRNLQSETLAGVLAGDILIQNHCYRGDEMAVMLDIAREFGYRIASFHHAVEAYKVRDRLAETDTCASMWADWWGFKLESYDGIRANIALVDEAGACAILHTDDAGGIQRMNVDAAVALAAGLEAGIDLDRDDALRWITINPARALGIADGVGSLEAGKRADVVVWSGDPFSIYSEPELVFIDGALAYDRADASRQPLSDFMLGNLPEEVIP
ncbi:MAG TPA: amidohydrolase [Longimicrobiales bacterium]|nr:amidohydrolase [Longimicrobiales bacterium]